MAKDRTEYRVLTPDDAADWFNLQRLSYGGGDTPPAPEESAAIKMSQRRGLFAAGRLVAGLHLLPMRSYCGDTLLPSGGIGSVATLPERRREGHAFKLIRHCLDELHACGFALSPLYPFKYSFYRRLGWEHAVDMVTYEVPLADLSWHTGGGRIRLVSKSVPGAEAQASSADIGTLQDVYRRWAKGYNGLWERDEAHWRRFILKARNLLCVAAVWETPAGEPEGYVIYRQDAFGEGPLAIRVRELAAVSSQAYRGLLGLLHTHEGTYTTVRFGLPPTDPLSLFLPNPRVKRELRSHSMWRLVDLASAVPAMAGSAPGEGRVGLSVADPDCPWNAGEWSLEGAAQGLTLVRGLQPGVPRVSLGIGTLAQIACGYLSAGRARAAGLLEAPAEAALGLLDALSGGRPAHLSDYF